MAGHVFVVRSDLRRLALDAWLLPCGRDAQPLPSWVDGAWTLSWPRPPADWGALRTMRLEGMPAGRATPWVTHVGAPPEPVPTTGSPTMGRGRPWRLRPPRSAARSKSGEVIRAQLGEMYGAAERLDIDCVLVTFDGPTHAAAQAERRRWLQERGEPGWPDVDPELMKVAKGLARKANRGELVLFLGAGLSTGAGLPLWGALLDDLADRAGMDEAERLALSKLDVLDQAELVES